MENNQKGPGNMNEIKLLDCLTRNVKKLIQSLLGKAGYEIRPINAPVANFRSSMEQGLQWIQKNGFFIETILDVGASDGRWSKNGMVLFPDAKFVLFEPQPVHSRDLSTFANSFPGRVIPVKKAVGADDGHLLFDVSDPFGGGVAKMDSKKTLQVEQTKLDTSVSELDLKGPFLLKLDTHGFERSILNSAEHTLQKCEVLIIEAYNYRISDEAFLFWELCVYLSERGFRPIDVVDLMYRKHDNSLWQMDLFFIRSTWNGFNHDSYE